MEIYTFILFDAVLAIMAICIFVYGGIFIGREFGTFEKACVYFIDSISKRMQKQTLCVLCDKPTTNSRRLRKVSMYLCESCNEKHRSRYNIYREDQR